MTTDRPKADRTKVSRPSIALSEQRILDAAVELVLDRGLQALSVRALARELRVTPMAIYRYVPSKQALLRAVQPLLDEGAGTEGQGTEREGNDDRLCLDLIVREALDIASEQGLGSLSMRALARRLGVTPMSIYRYVANKAALLSAMTDAILDGLPHPEPTPDNWETCFREHAHAMWTRFAAYPGLVGAFASGPSPRVLEHMRYERSLLLVGGADPHTASVAITVYHTFMLGLFRSHAYMHSLAQDATLGVDPSRIRRFGEQLYLVELLDFSLAAVVTKVRESARAAQP